MQQQAEVHGRNRSLNYSYGNFAIFVMSALVMAPTIWCLVTVSRIEAAYPARHQDQSPAPTPLTVVSTCPDKGAIAPKRELTLWAFDEIS
jgi:hypothetical protein